jgi:hypothetical protein
MCSYEWSLLHGSLILGFEERDKTDELLGRFLTGNVHTETPCSGLAWSCSPTR